MAGVITGDVVGSIGGSGCTTRAAERGTSQTDSRDAEIHGGGEWTGNDVYVDVDAGGARVDTGKSVVREVRVKARAGGSTCSKHCSRRCTKRKAPGPLSMQRLRQPESRDAIGYRTAGGQGKDPPVVCPRG